MKQNTNSPQAQLFGLVDAAACPGRISALLERSGERFQSVYAGLPEQEAGLASLFVVRVGDEKADWVEELSQIDLHTPCLSLLWSRVDLDPLVTHLQAFLFADIGDNMTALVRFFDPRNIDVVPGIWGEQVCSMFMGPFEQWLYRGRHSDWQRIRNESNGDARICRSVLIRLNQAEVDTLMAHTEPDELLATLIASEVVDGARPYLERFNDFYPRYQKAQQWGLTEASDRLIFCQHTYRYGSEFDRHYRIHDLLSQRKKTGQRLAFVIQEVPPVVWKEIDMARRLQNDPALTSN
jgi:hypothetical protein